MVSDQRVLVQEMSVQPLLFVTSDFQPNLYITIPFINRFTIRAILELILRQPNFLTPESSQRCNLPISTQLDIIITFIHRFALKANLELILQQPN